MKKKHPILERVQEIYRVDKIFLKVLEGQIRHGDDLMFVNSCLNNLIQETKKQAVTSKQYIDHLQESLTWRRRENDLNTV